MILHVHNLKLLTEHRKLEFDGCRTVQHISVEKGVLVTSVEVLDGHSQLFDVEKRPSLLTNTKSLAKEFSKILIFEYFGYLSSGFDVFFNADSESPRMT